METICQITQTEAVTALFAGWKDTLISSCLQNIMGQVYADAKEKPGAAMAVLGDFCFLTGKPNRELVLHIRRVVKKDFMILVPQNEQWAQTIEECFGKRARRVIRYATRKDTVFDEEHLNRIVAGVPQGYTLRMIDEELFMKCRDIPWCRDWVAQYADYARYKKHGLGAVILKEGEPVSGASSYSGYTGGIEIEIDTKEEYRRRGFAYICGAKLILECLKKDWYPSWDAQNRWSLALSEKLGYQFDHEYPAYEVTL